MVTIHVNFGEVRVFLSILLRISLVFFLLPIFSNNRVPMMIKAGASAGLAILLYPFLQNSVIPLPIELVPLVMTIVMELLFGFILSLSMLLIFASFQFAGELLTFQMGLGFAQVVDPQSGSQTMVLGRWFQLLTLLLLFAFNGHHVVLSALFESFHNVPLGGFALHSLTFSKMMALAGELFVTAVKMAAPVMIVLMLMQVGLGLTAKFSPQINILMTSFPLTIFLGLTFMAFSVSIWGDVMGVYFQHVMDFMRGFTK